MAKCEMYGAGKAFKMKERFDNYSDGKTVVCEVARKKCPYDNEGHNLECPDNKVRIICSSQAGVKESGLIIKIEDFLDKP